VARVTIYSVDGKAVSFRELSSGDLFGEYPALDGGPRSASVEARSACTVGLMHGPAFLELVEREPKVQRVLRQLVMTIRRLTTRVYEFSTLAVNRAASVRTGRPLHAS
jgi:CRP-like cAMP-binding protein